jgi:serine phosphatase RsbU (regulator of sigma subunit)
MTNRIVLFFVFFLCGLFAHSQQTTGKSNPLMDSLTHALQVAQHDTVRCTLLNAMVDAEADNRIWPVYNEQLRGLCETHLKKQAPGTPLYVFYLKLLASAFNNKGLNFKDRGDIPMAIEYYQKSLKIGEELKDNNLIAIPLNNMGGIYRDQGDTSKALANYQKSLKIGESLHDRYVMAMCMNNIGAIYYRGNDFLLAKEYYSKSLKLMEEINDRHGICIALSNLGNIFREQGDAVLALRYGKRCLHIEEELNDKEGIAFSLNDIAMASFKMGQMEDARRAGECSLQLAKEIGYPENIKISSKTLATLYSKTGNWRKAFEMQVLYEQMHDSIFNQANRKLSIRKSFQYEYEKKVAADSVREIEEHKVVEGQMKQEKTKRTALFIGIGLFAVFSLFMYNRFRVTSKQKGIIEIQKVEVAKQRDLADIRREIAEAQREVIGGKQKEILDSIHYALRIQQAMLTSEEYFNEQLKAEHFIFYQPKDIVSGDFYWAVSHNQKFYLATADCTGHGVPGAFMSLLNISFLNENVIERGIQSPGQILTEQRKEIIKALNPKGNENSKDGMDCVLCAFDLQQNKLEFAAANNPLWLIRNKELIDYKGDKMPVGKGEDQAKDFTNQTIDLQKGDIIYTFTDGYADQFGGSKGKKFMYKQLAQLLLDNHHLPLTEQRDLLARSLNVWKGNHEQVDDILVIGVRV